ncbi:MAG TPA: hypothetical protein VG223_11845, partial [Solirubrobacteraceae bacterium]|nr:hypothetical protein [Solirubrobacteraceae bacterium]
MSPLRLAVAPLAAAWALAGLAAGAPAALGATATDPTPTQAIAELNTWRAQVGERPVSTTPVASWDTGCEQANAYDDDNQTLTHQEAQASPGYTTTGADAASNSVLAEGGSLRAPAEASLLPGPVWDSSVFHRAALLEPRFGQTGFDASTFHPSNYQSYECMWVQDDTTNNINAINDAVTTPGLSLYPSPANGAYDVPTTFPGGESPDPAIETGVPAGSTLGWLLNVEINGPWSDGGNGGSVFASGVTAKLTADGTATTIPVVVSQCGSAGCFSPGGTSDGIYFGGGFGIFPTKPLKPSTTYRVQLTGGQVTDQPDSTSYPLAGFSWCFSTGSSYAPSADCA